VRRREGRGSGGGRGDCGRAATGRYNLRVSDTKVIVAGARPIAALAIASVLAMGASIEYFGLIEKLTQQSGDGYRIGVQVDRFAPIAARTGGAARLGYFNDREKGSVGAQAALSSAQFALAPQLLIVDQERKDIEWWVGDFTAPREFVKIGDVLGMSLAADLGNGVVLYRRRVAK